MRTESRSRSRFSISINYKLFDILCKYYDWFNCKIKITQNSQRCKHLTNWNSAIIIIDLTLNNIDSKFKWKLFDLKKSESLSLTVTLRFCCRANEQRSERFIQSFNNEFYKIK